jgi:hypothetical protein
VESSWRIYGRWSGWPQLCIYDHAPNVDVNWQIIDWTALTDKANGNALKDANACVVGSSLKKANFQVMLKAPRHGYD